MDLVSIIGLVGAVFMMLIGILLEGTNLLFYLNITSIFITLGGSAFATAASNNFENLRNIPSLFRVVFFFEKIDPSQTILSLLSFSERARREGLLALEDDLEQIPVNDIFLRTGIELIVDGTDPEVVKNILSAELSALDARHMQMKKIVDDMAYFCPSFGMIGTILGLVAMMRQLGGGVDAIGRGMGIALLTTLYGSILANAVFIPIANKLEKKNTIEVTLREIIVEGVLSIQAGDNPRILQRKLLSYLPPADRNEIESQTGEPT